MNTETENKVIKAVSAWVTEQGGPDLEFFPHDHLDLPEGCISTYIEGWYPDDIYGMLAVSEAISEGVIQLPEGVYHEMYSHVEMYFYEDPR